MTPECESRLWGLLIALAVAVAALEALGLLFSMVGTKGKGFVPEVGK